MLESGAYSGFFLGGCGRVAPENFFSHPGAELLRTHPFRTHPVFRIFLFLDQLKKILTPSTPTPLFAFLPFWTNFNFAHKTHESGTEQENLGGQAD